MRKSLTIKNQDFVICCGYKGSMIKQFFSDYFLKTSDITIDLGQQSIEYHRKCEETWRVTLVDTGLNTMTGGRIRRVAHHLGKETFCMTYGDGVSDVDINKVIAFHREHGRTATITAVPSPGRFGILDIRENGQVSRFHEKPDNEMGYINGGYFVLEPESIDYIEGDATSFEKAPLERLAAQNKLAAYKHPGFWRPMDSLRDKRELEDMWATGNAPWKTW